MGAGTVRAFLDFGACMDAHTPRLRIAVVTTRDIEAQNGRAQILAAIVESLANRNDVMVMRLSSVAETKAWVSLAWAWAVSLLRFRPRPLQCLLYAANDECERIADLVVGIDCDAVYLDTVRCQTLLHKLRSKRPGLHIVTDFDDLMSRRAKFLADKRLAFATGHAGRHFPRWLRYLIDVALAPAVTAYEAATLPAAEDDVIAGSDATVLISSADRRHLCSRLAHARSVYAIGPAVHMRSLPWTADASFRFVFVGSDNFIQNRTAIDFLTRYWSAHHPTTALHIYGRQHRPQPQIEGIHWHGYVENIAEVYLPGSIALVPALDRGGIKTKVLEAWSWGCPVLGNAAAFEGLSLVDYPLALPESAWTTFLADPEAHAAIWIRAAALGSAFVRGVHTPERFELAWSEVMRPSCVALTAQPSPALHNIPAQHALERFNSFS